MSEPSETDSRTLRDELTLQVRKPDPGKAGLFLPFGFTNFPQLMRYVVIHEHGCQLPFLLSCFHYASDLKGEKVYIAAFHFPLLQSNMKDEKEWSYQLQSCEKHK